MVLENPGTSLPLGANQRKRAKEFYYPLLFLDSVQDCCQHAIARKVADAPQNPNQSSEADFRTLVNKLAHICDYRPAGDTVTALVVLAVDGRIVYAFASNSRKRPNLIQTKNDLTSVLNILKANLEAETKESDQALFDRLLRQILRLNTVRVRMYLTHLTKDLAACVKACEGDASEETKSSSQELQKLHDLIPKTDEAGQTSDAYTSSVIRCIQTIEQYRRSPLQQFIKKKAATEEKLRKNKTPWSNLHHVGGRLLSYGYDAETLISAHHMWEDSDLFREFEVNFLDSSQSNIPKPLEFSPQTIESLVNGMPASACNAREKKALIQHAAELRKYDLDKILEGQWQRKLNPIVHAEMILHDWLSRTPGGLQPSRFFGGWQYIGTSKPVCRLCRYYFDIIATPVHFRDGHPNSYVNWRLPDIRPQGNRPQDMQQANDDWCKIMEQIKTKVYADLRRVLEEQKTDQKMNDSNTYTDRLTLAGLLMNSGV